ncbi:MAG: DUF4956 domain-containing protein [Lachnospiraceae bacterium]|nr:DUF4956 domain-containing protein [Lachnospiraceae bacterium]
MSNIFNSIFATTAETIPCMEFIGCIGVSLIIGVFLAWLYSLRNKATKSFLISVAIMPAIVCVVIMMVNGNVGAGVGVAGGFSLVRFRSAPGSAREISTIFIAMGAGLIAGMGYLAYAAVFTVVLAVIMTLLTYLKFKGTTDESRKNLRITIPEDLNYTEAFTDILKDFTDEAELISVKTSNMGSLFKLRYSVALKEDASEKEFIDMLRTRNGNLEVSMDTQEVAINEL